MFEVKACEGKENQTTFHERLNESSGSAAIYNTQQYECLTALKGLKLQNGKPQIMKEGSQKSKTEWSLPKDKVMVSKSNIDNVEEKHEVKLYRPETLLEKTSSPCNHHEGSANQNLEVGIRQQRTENIINLIQQHDVFDLCTPLASKLVFNNANEKICQEMPAKYPENGNRQSIGDISNCQVMTDPTEYASEMAAILKDLSDPNLYKAALNSIIKPQGISSGTPVKVVLAQANTETNNCQPELLHNLEMGKEHYEFKNSIAEITAIYQNLIARGPHNGKETERKKRTGKKVKQKIGKNKTRNSCKSSIERGKSKTTGLHEGTALPNISSFTKTCVHPPVPESSQFTQVCGRFENEKYQNSDEQTNTHLSDTVQDSHADETSDNHWFEDILQKTQRVSQEEIQNILNDLESTADNNQIMEDESYQNLNINLELGRKACTMTDQSHTYELDNAAQSQWTNRNPVSLTSGRASNFASEELVKNDVQISAFNNMPEYESQIRKVQATNSVHNVPNSFICAQDFSLPQNQPINLSASCPQVVILLPPPSTPPQVLGAPGTSKRLRPILPKTKTTSSNPAKVMTQTYLSTSSMACTPSTSTQALADATRETKIVKDHGKAASEEHKERIRKRFEKSELNKLERREENKKAPELTARSRLANLFPWLVQCAVAMHEKKKLIACMQLYLEDRKSGASMLPNISLLERFRQTTLFDKANDEELGFLIASGVDQNIQGQYRMSSSLGSILHFAVESGRVQTVQTLCEFLDTSKDETNSNGFAPLHLAVKLKNRAKARKIIATLLESGAEPNIVVATNGKTPLHLAMERDHFSKEIVKLLINSPKIDVNLNTYSKQSPLHVGMTELLDDMIRNNDDGETLRRKNMKDCIVMLVQKGARVDGGTELKKRATERFGRNCNFIALHQKLKGIAQ